MFRRLTSKVRGLLDLPAELRGQTESLRLAVGRIEARQVAAAAPRSLTESEFQVSSQWGEDGIIQHLIRSVPIERRVFVEFGVQDYRESNTRFLLQHDNWSGLVMDGSARNIEAIRRDAIYWRHNLKAECAFVTRENINSLIEKQGIVGDIGLLSIDIDGNDYWVWQALECISPRIVIVEYNSLFGPAVKVTVPYDPAFVRGRAHYSNLFWGASLSALCDLAGRKGYVLLGSNSAGNNAFFARADVASALSAMSPQQAWVQASFRESRDASGNLTFLSAREAVQVIAHLQVLDIVANRSVTLHEAMEQTGGYGYWENP